MTPPPPPPIGRRNGPTRHSIDGCRANVARDFRCTWPDCQERRASQRDDDYGDAPLCVGHFYEVWRLARDLADRTQNRKPERDVLVVSTMTATKVEVPVSTLGWIYYLRIGESIKVGYAGDLDNRMKAYPPTAEFLFAHPGTKNTEKSTHSLLGLHRNARREWYDDCPGVREYIAQMVARYSGGQHRGPGSFFRDAVTPPSDQPMRMRRRSAPPGRRIA